MSRERISAQTAAEFSAWSADFFEHFCPEQQINRDFVIDVIIERSNRTQDFDVTNAAFAWLAE